MQSRAALKAGLAGGLALNLLHESARQVIPDAPHVDQIAMRAIGKSLQRLGMKPLSLRTLRRTALVGDLISNSLYYSLVGSFEKRGSLWAGASLLGIAAGAGAVFLPPRMGLGQQPSRNFPLTAALTVSWYLCGALVSAAAYRVFTRNTPVRGQRDTLIAAA